jgi:hypothetical protein
VIDVVGTDDASGRDGEHDQCSRVGPTGQRTRGMRARGRERAAREEVASFVQQSRVQRSLSLWRLPG